jgi:hypothetical protein
MSKPVDVIFAYKAAVDQESAIEKAADQAVDCYARFFSQVAGLTREYALLCQQFGRDNLLAQLPADVAAALEAGRTSLETFWAANSPYPFPEMPAEPVETPPVENGGGE